MTQYLFNDYVPGISWSTVDRRFSLRERDEETGAPAPVPLDPTQRFLMDIASARWGSICYAPKFELLTVPLGEERPIPPDTKGEDGKALFQSVIELKLFSPQFGGMRMLLAGGAFFTRMILTFIGDAEACPEAEQGLIPVVDWVGDAARKVTRGPGAGRTYYVPELRIVGWMERLPAFGPRTVKIPEPAPMLAAPTMQLGPNPGDIVALPAPKRQSKTGRIIDDQLPF